MRNFNDYEKEFLTLITTIPKEQVKLPIMNNLLSVSDLFEKLAKDEEVKILFNRDEKVAKFVSGKLPITIIEGSIVPDNMHDWVLASFEELQRITLKSILLISLLDYLERNHLIYLYPIWENSNHLVTLNGDIDFDFYPSGTVFLGGDEFESTFKRLNHSLLPTPELVEFVEKGFKDEEQIRHEQNVKLQSQSIKLATSLAVISIIISLISLVPEESKEQLFSNIKNNVPVEERESNRHSTGTIISKEIRTRGKQPVGMYLQSPK